MSLSQEALILEDFIEMKKKMKFDNEKYEQTHTYRSFISIKNIGLSAQLKKLWDNYYNKVLLT